MNKKVKVLALSISLLVVVALSGLAAANVGSSRDLGVTNGTTSSTQTVDDQHGQNADLNGANGDESLEAEETPGAEDAAEVEDANASAEPEDAEVEDANAGPEVEDAEVENDNINDGAQVGAEDHGSADDDGSSGSSDDD